MVLHLMPTDYALQIQMIGSHGILMMVVTFGCTDPYAENYNADANIDDGSCTYPDNGNYSLSFDGENDIVEIIKEIMNLFQ